MATNIFLLGGKTVYMNTKAERKRKKLEEFCAEKGLKHVADMTGLNWQYIDQAIKKTLLPPKKDGSRSYRKLSDEAFEKIEDAYELGRGWFDDQQASATDEQKTITGLTPSANELALLYDMIPSTDLVRRSRAWSAATEVIRREIEGH